MTILEIIADAAPQPSEKLLLWTLILTSAGSFVTALFALIKGQLDRVQDRLDAESKAKLILAAGANREKRINEKIEENTKISKEAFEAANGHNEKIAKATELAQKAIETAATKRE